MSASTNPLVFDFETSVIPNVGDFSGEIGRPPARMKDPEKIKAWIENATVRASEFAALDFDLARIVCGVWCSDGVRLRGAVAKNEDEERVLLQKFWKAVNGTGGNAGRPTLIGFNILEFDLPLAVRRSQYLDVAYPEIEMSRYRHRNAEDLMQILTFDGKVNARKLEFYCRRFGIEVEDKFNGADVPNLVMLGDYESVKAHCIADVRKEWKLAERLGVLDVRHLHQKADENTIF